MLRSKTFRLFVNSPAQIQKCTARAGTDQQQAGFQNSGKGLFGTEEKRFEVVGGDKKRSATKKKSDLGWIDQLEEIDAALDDF